MREDGFVCVSVGEDAGKLTREALEATRDFHALTREEKERVHHSTGAPGDKVGGYFRKGEEPFYENEKKGSEGVDASHVEDFCVHLDMLNGGARDNQIWPRSPVNFKPLLLKFCREMVRIGSSLHRALAKGLKLPPHFDFRQSPSLMRLLRYPPKPKHGNITAHTDYEVFTLIHQDVKGLQVYQNGEWCWAPMQESSGNSRASSNYIMMPNDMIEFWTNGQIPALKHRVLNLSEDHERYSIVIFFAANEDTCAEPVDNFVLPHQISRADGMRAAVVTRRVKRMQKYCSAYLKACSNAKVDTSKGEKLTQLIHLNARVAESDAITRKRKRVASTGTTTSGGRRKESHKKSGKQVTLTLIPTSLG